MMILLSALALSLTSSSTTLAKALKLRGGDAVDVMTTASVGLQIVGGMYGCADPAGNIRAFGGLSADAVIEPFEVAMMRYCASQQVLAGCVLLSGQECDMRVAECVALTGNALSFLTTPAYTSPGSARSAPLFAWLVTLAGLGEARRSEHPRAGTFGISLLGLAGLQAAVAPKACLDMYNSKQPASARALAFLSLGGANQLASMVYIAVTGRAGRAGDGHAKGLLSFLCANVAACAKFGLVDAERAGFQKFGALGWATIVSTWAAVVGARVARGAKPKAS